MKNIDKIRQMTADELAEYMRDNDACHCCLFSTLSVCNGNIRCKEGIKQWLEQESEE